MTSARKGALSAFVGMASRASGQIFTISVTLVATRYLSPSDFGIFAIAILFVTLSRTLLYSGPFEYMMKVPELDNSASECASVNIILSIVFLTILTVVSFLYSFIFASPAVGGLLFLLAPSIIVAAISSWEEALVLRSGNVRLYYYINIVIEFISCSIAIILLISGYGIKSLVGQIYLRVILSLLAYYFIAKIPQIRRPRLSHMWEIFHWSISRYGSVVLNFLTTYSGDLILGVTLSSAATGLYRAGSRIVGAASDIFAQPAAIISMSNLSHRYATGKPADAYWIEMFSGMAFFAWSALAGMALVANELTPLILGQEWRDAGPVISVLCVARLAGFVTIFAGTSLFVYDQQRRVFLIQLATTVVVTSLTLLMAPRFGVVGAAAAAAIGSWMSAGALLFASAKLGRPTRKQTVRALTVILVPFGATILGTWLGMTVAPLWASTPIPRLSIAIVFGIAGWLTAALLVRRLILDALKTLAREE